MRRGGSDIKEIVKRIDMWALDMVFVVGGNGGNAGADAIQQECHKAGVPCSVIGVPKSIDNDILLVRSSPPPLPPKILVACKERCHAAVLVCLMSVWEEEKSSRSRSFVCTSLHGCIHAFCLQIAEAGLKVALG